MPGKRHRTEQKKDGDGKYRSKSIIVNPLFIVLILVEVTEKSGFHAERKYRIQYGHIAEHGGQDAIGTQLVGNCVDRGEKKGEYPCGYSTYPVNGCLACKFFSGRQ